MHKILGRIFQSDKTKPSKAVQKNFTLKFGESINVEWHREQDNYEALFYIDDTEHIALFAPDGKLLEQKKNLLLTDAKEDIAFQAELVGEMMNLIEINRGDTLLYEVIARDGLLDRYSLLLDNFGKLLEKKKL